MTDKMQKSHPDKGATRHVRAMGRSSLLLLVLLPLFIATFGTILGSSYDEVRAYYAKPFPAFVGILTLVIGFYHFKCGAQVMIEDYTRAKMRKILIMICTLVSYGAMLVGSGALVGMLLRIAT